MIPAPALEIAVLLWGLILLLAGHSRADGSAGFAIAESPGSSSCLWRVFSRSATNRRRHRFLEFLCGRSARHLFKRFALVTTILVLIMAIDYAPAIRMGVPGANPHAGLGEFFTLPISPAPA